MSDTLLKLLNCPSWVAAGLDLLIRWLAVLGIALTFGFFLSLAFLLNSLLG